MISFFLFFVLRGEGIQIQSNSKFDFEPDRPMRVQANPARDRIYSLFNIGADSDRMIRIQTQI